MEEIAGLSQGFTPPREKPLVIILKLSAMLALVYLFILSIMLMGDSFKLFGEGFAERILTATANPVAGLMIGLLVTAVVQSSSTTTSLIVGLVASGVLSFEASVPMIMGANIGTSITNILVSLGHISRGDEFKRAFCGSMLHDFFNVCSVIVLLPLQIKFNLIGRSAHFVEGFFAGFGGLKFVSPLKVITKPVSEALIEMTGDSGILSLLIAFLFLFAALHFIVRVLKSLVLSRVEKFFQRYVFRTPILGFLLGMVVTALVQSSSITTSVVVPLIGAGVISIVQVYPYLLGANVGTTITAFLASFVTGSDEAVSVAFAHLLFNVYGIGIFWPLKRIPIWLATKLAELTQKSKLVPILYIVILFFIIPGIVLYFFN